MSSPTTTKPPLRLRIPHKLWPRFGDNTLSGIYAKAMLADTRGDNQFDHQNVILEVEQTSFQYRRIHGGPAEMIVPEFLPLCLMRNIISMMSQKHKLNISIEVVEIHTKPDGVD